MEEQPGLSDQYRMASPWPLFVALGLALSEVGIFIGLFSVAVAGILLFGGSVAGILRESGYVSEPWGTLVGLGGVFALAGAAIVMTQLDPGVGLLALIADPVGAPGRGLAIAAGGTMLLLAGATGSIVGKTGY